MRQFASVWGQEEGAGLMGNKQICNDAVPQGVPPVTVLLIKSITLRSRTELA